MYPTYPILAMVIIVTYMYAILASQENKQPC